MIFNPFVALLAIDISLKLKAAFVGLGALILAQEIPVAPASPVPQWLDLGVTIAAIGLLGYILRLVFSGGLVSKEVIEQVAEKAVRETLRNMNYTND